MHRAPGVGEITRLHGACAARSIQAMQPDAGVDELMGAVGRLVSR